MLELFAQAVAQQQPQAGFQSLIPGLLSALTAAIGGVTAYMIAKLSSKADVMVKTAQETKVTTEETKVVTEKAADSTEKIHVNSNSERAELMKKFDSLHEQVLTLSKANERLEAESRGHQRSSSQAPNQQLSDDQLQQIIRAIQSGK